MKVAGMCCQMWTSHFNENVPVCWNVEGMRCQGRVNTFLVNNHKHDGESVTIPHASADGGKSQLVGR